MLGPKIFLYVSMDRLRTLTLCCIIVDATTCIFQQFIAAIHVFTPHDMHAVMIASEAH